MTTQHAVEPARISIETFENHVRTTLRDHALSAYVQRSGHQPVLMIGKSEQPIASLHIDRQARGNSTHVNALGTLELHVEEKYRGHSWVDVVKAAIKAAKE